MPKPKKPLPKKRQTKSKFSVAQFVNALMSAGHYYVMACKGGHGGLRDGFKLYEGKQNPIGWISDHDARMLRTVLVTDPKSKKMLLSKRAVQSLRKNSTIKKIYLSKRSTKVSY